MTDSPTAARVPTLRGGLWRFFAAGADAPRLNDGALIDRAFRSKRVAIMSILTAAYSVAYTCRIGTSVVKKPLIDAGIFSADDFGVIGATWTISYGIWKMINGLLVDHGNMKRLLPFGLAMSAVINLAIGGSSYLSLWIVLWAVNGCFQGFLAPGSVVSISQWFSNHERGRAYGTWSMGHSLGELLTFVVSAGFVTWFGWRGAFLGPAVIALAMAVVAFVLLQDRPETLGLPSVADWKNDHAPKDLSHAARDTRAIQIAALKLPAVWIVGVASALVYVTRYALNSWGILYLQEAKSYTLLEAGSLLGLNTVAGFVGSISYGFISDLLFDARRPPANLLFGLIEIAGLLGFFFGPQHSSWVTATSVIAIGFGLNGLVTALGGLFAVDLAPKRATGTMMGLVGMFSYIGASVQERLSGWLIDTHTTMVDGVRHYDFSPVIGVWVGASVLSLLLALSLWRAKPVD